MAITSTTSTTATTSTTSTSPLADASKQMLDENTFLKLLVAQVSHQDPMKPTDSSEWMSQMAQLSSVEQLTKVATTTSDSAKDAKVTSALGMLGRQVAYETSDGSGQGTVESVTIDATAGPLLTVDGQSGIGLDKVVEVQ